MALYTQSVSLPHLDGVQLEDWDFIPNAITRAMEDSGRRCDAGSALIFAQQLQYMRAQILDKKYPELKARRLIPQQAEAPVGAEEYAYRIADEVGMFELITNYADDLPVTNVRGEKHVANIATFGGAVHFSIDDMERASMAGLPLQARQMSANRSAAERKFERIAWQGDATAGIYGMLNHPNITKVSDSTVGLNSKRFQAMTAEEMYKVLTHPILQQIKATNGVESPNVYVMDPADYEAANNAFFMVAGTMAGESAMARFKREHPEITVETSAYMTNTTGSGQKNALLAFRNDPERVAMESPLPYTVEPPQFRNLATIVNARMKTAGVIAYFPLSITVIEGM